MAPPHLRRFARTALGLAACAALGFSFLRGQQVTPTSGIDLPVLGHVKARAASEIPSSSWWSIGGETIDRDFTVYDHYKKFLGPLGAKSIRLQGGWAKCEKTKGVYSWEWLDAIVNDAVAQGVQPWLEFNYGNPVYPGGGDTGLGGGFPSSPEALAAWDRWARALVERYQDRVHQWEVWNEPDINNRGTATVDAYIDLYIRTASIVREVQTKGQVWALALAHRIDYADAFLAGMKARGKLALIDAITFHGYPRNPDDTRNADQLREVIARHGATIPIRQGETGATSKYQENFALSKISWTETTQAKWDLRRLLAHRGKDIPMNLFTLCDMHYTQVTNQTGTDGVIRMNYKGLLGTNPDQTISHVKPIYAAAQTVFSIFDDTVSRIPEYPFTTTALRGLALTGYEKQGSGQIVALWFHDAPPDEGNGVTHVNVTLPSGRFTEIVLIDVRTSTVYSFPKDGWTQDANGTSLRRVPVYDSPLLIAERSAISLAPGPH